ncbi:hypothetical protein AALO_G00228440 [Alosa alosa]|uniref:Tc1-like transposase DDE domain-containing protein n=1 Tax=Alosa alosa TaxID=278164 RepID=A0AAV6FYU0_9TELE|nr:hypothetical protein AALO_G00228440 [Alosa alosa]
MESHFQLNDHRRLWQRLKMISDFGSKSITSDWQSPSLNPIEHLWRDLKMAVLPIQHSQSNLIELERFCKEEWAKLAKYGCAKLVASYSKREAVIAAKGATTKY